MDSENEVVDEQRTTVARTRKHGGGSADDLSPTLPGRWRKTVLE